MFRHHLCWLSGETIVSSETKIVPADSAVLSLRSAMLRVAGRIPQVRAAARARRTHMASREFAVGSLNSRAPDLTDLKQQLAKTTQRMSKLAEEELELKEAMERLERIKAQKRILFFEEARLKEAIVNTYNYSRDLPVGWGSTTAIDTSEKKEKKQKKEKKHSANIAAGSNDTTMDAVKTSTSTEITAPKPMSKKISDGWKHFKAEMVHYWLGGKLLYANIQTASDIMKLVLKGKSLTRR